MATGPISRAWTHDRSGHLLETSAASPVEIATARHDATAHLRRCGCSNVANAVLVLSELVSNAVLHSGGADRILVECDGASIQISVHDHGAEPARLRDQVGSIGGRGLHIVDKLAGHWASISVGDGKDVVATVPCR